MTQLIIYLLENGYSFKHKILEMSLFNSIKIEMNEWQLMLIFKLRYIDDFLEIIDSHTNEVILKLIHIFLNENKTDEKIRPTIEIYRNLFLENQKRLI